jgi:hypothetical protein
MINVIRGIGCSNDASFEVVEKFENFKDASVRTLYTFVKEYAIEVAKERQENTMGHEFPLVEMVEDSNGLPIAQVWVDRKIKEQIFCEEIV